MKDDIIGIIKKQFNIKEDSSIEFREMYGLTFVFKTKIIMISGEPKSGEIRPLGIIYKEDDDYYFAPLTQHNNINEIVRKYVENCLEN